MYFSLFINYYNIKKSNARDTTYFTIKCLQTDVASKVEVAMSLK